MKWNAVVNVLVDEKAIDAGDPCFGNGVCEIGVHSHKNRIKGKEKAHGNGDKGCIDDCDRHSHSYDWRNEVGCGVD